MALLGISGLGLLSSKTLFEGKARREKIAGGMAIAGTEDDQLVDYILRASHILPKKQKLLRKYEARGVKKDSELYLTAVNHFKYIEDAVTESLDTFKAALGNKIAMGHSYDDGLKAAMKAISSVIEAAEIEANDIYEIASDQKIQVNVTA